MKLWISDPKDGQPSVSLTLLALATLVYVGAIIASFVLEFVNPKTLVPTDDAFNFFLGAAGLYFGRRTKMSKGSLDDKV